MSGAGLVELPVGLQGEFKAMSSAGQLGGWIFHPIGTMSEVMNDDNFHNLSFLISSSTVMIYGLMQSIRKKAM